jgi:soluble lytic murein transglycosylase
MPNRADRAAPRYRSTFFEASHARLDRLVASLRSGLLLICILAHWPVAGWASDADRSLYREALRLLAAGRVEAFRDARVRLDGYVLAPYLDYHDLVRRLDQVGEPEMRAFRAANSDLPVSRLLYHRWLTRLGQQAEWSLLARNPPDEPDTELHCLFLQAQIEQGVATALAEVASLWTVGRSQPPACDPVFDAWIAAGGLRQALAWKRLVLAVEADQPGLARYLLRFLEGDALPRGQALYEVHVTPDAVLERARFGADNDATRTVLTHGLKRLATGNPDAARDAWADYRKSHAFSAEQQRAIAAAILLADGRQGRLEEPWPADLAHPVPAELAAALAQTAVNRQQWSAARYWIGQLTPAQQTETRWQYWAARALEVQPDMADERQARYRKLAGERDYYGFLAAQRAALPPRLNAAASRYDPTVDRAVRAMPAVQRALELYAVGDLLNARREWYRLLPTLDPLQQVHAAYIAQRSGWIPQSIQMANSAMLRDHVDLRFPVAYPELFAEVSARTAVAKPFLLAIARQESLFDPGARSSADARGLMQLLPTTATWVAQRNALVAPATAQLHEPAVNVDLGGRYLAQLLSRYGDRRPLAAAAYNAGQGRVDRWIADRSGEPVDIWIENIPFTETRNYVKNVMAFTQVYGQVLDAPVPMLAPHEATVP